MGQTTDVGNKDAASRRSTRIPHDVLVEVQGESFAYAGETLRVSLHGALIRIAAPLQLGDRIVLHVQETGKSAEARIVFMDAGTLHFGMEFVTPENIWGITAPPDDWQGSTSAQ
jgi:hypothetical protein